MGSSSPPTPAEEQYQYPPSCKGIWTRRKYAKTLTNAIIQVVGFQLFYFILYTISSRFFSNIYIINMIHDYILIVLKNGQKKFKKSPLSHATSLLTSKHYSCIHSDFLFCINIQGGAKVGLQLCVHETLFLYYYLLIIVLQL